MKLLNKRLVSFLLAVVMLLGMMPMQVFATEGTQETEAVEVVTEPTEAPEEETTAPTEETEPSDEEEEEEPSEPSESKEEPEVVHEHDYEAVVTDPTCTEQGYTTYTCACGDSYVDDVSMDITDRFKWNEGYVISAFNGNMMADKNWVASDYVDISAFESIEIVTGDTVNANTTLGIAFYDANKKFVSGVVHTDKTGTEYGILVHNLEVPQGVSYLRTTWYSVNHGSYNGATLHTFYCKGAGTAIPPLGHDYVLTEETKPNCSAGGTKVYICSRCGESTQETTSKGDHAYDNGICIGCGSSILGNDWIAPYFAEGDYSMVVLPDTQKLVTSWEDTYYEQMQWIADNEDALNIQAVLHMGDMVDNNTAREWTICEAGTDILQNAGIPWMPMRGNHDDADYFNNYYDYTTYGTNQSWFGGAYHSDKLEHTYWFVTVGQREYMILSLGWAPSWDVLAWAQDIVEAHSDKNVILTCHAYMNSDGTLLDSSDAHCPSSYHPGYPDGDDVWDAFKGYENVVLAMGGHIHSANIVTFVDQNGTGRDVTSLLVDRQNDDMANHYGMVAVLTFHNGSNTVDVNWYSVRYDALYRAKNQFSIDVPHVHSHEYVADITVPTCTEKGYTTYTCECGDIYVDDYVDAKGEHDFTEWSTIKEAAYNADGEESRKCSKCSHVEFRSVSVSVVTSGNLGKGTTPTDKVIYTLYSDGTMVLEGTGALFGIDWRGDNQPFIDYRKQVKHLVIGEGITSTTSGSLVKLSNLETIQFPSTLTHLPQNALMSCFRPDITKLTIPATVVHLGAYSIGHYTGDNSAYFTDVIIENPNIQITDHNAVFNGGAKLDQLTLYSYGVNNNVSSYAEKYGCKYVDLETYKTGEYSGVTYLYYSGVLTFSTTQNNATITGEDAPWNTVKDSVKKVVIGSGITGIAANAFKDYCSLESVELNNEIRTVGDGAFSTTETCNVTLTLTLPRTVKSVGAGIFAGRQDVNLTAYLGSAAAEIKNQGVKLTLKKQFQLLLIGNSYSEDASSCGQGMTESQLLNILQAMLGKDAEVTVALLSSGGKGMHWHATQAEQGNRAYSFKVISTTNPTWKSMGSYTSADALAWTDWDAVSLQPYNINVSTGQESVPYPDSTDPKFYHIEASSAYMLDHVAHYAPDADIYFYMHWAQTSSTVLNASLSTYNKHASFMPKILDYAGTESGAQFKTIIPVGLSIQNARTTYLALLRYNTTAYADGNLNLTTDAQIGLQRDGGHVSFNIGRYIAGLTFAETIVPQQWRVDNYVLPEIRVTESVGKLPKEYSEIAQKAVHAAVETWRNGSLAVTNIDGYTEDPTVAARKTLESLELNLNCGDATSIDQQICTSILSTLPADFAVETVILDADRGIATVTIRFGYTSVTVDLVYSTNHTYSNGICTGCGEAQPGPVITQQPTNGEAKLGEHYMVEVKAEGEGLKYQWYFRNAGSSKWNKSSVKDNTYDDVMTTARAGREVYCLITDANGNSVKTDTVKLVLLPSEELEITQQPTDDQVYFGEHFCATVEAKGEKLKYQWYFRNAGSDKWYKSSVKDNTYDDVMTKARAGREIYCVITDAYGNSVTTETVKLICIPTELEIISQPTSAEVYFGEMFCATVEAKGDGLKYQWYFRNSGTDKWYKSGVRDNTYDDVMTKARNHREIYCVITDMWGNSVTTDTVKLTAVPSVELKVLSQSYESAVMGERYCVTVEAQGDGLNYQWYFRNAGASRWSKSGVRDNTYDDVMNKTRANREVYCVISDACGNQITTEVITLTVEQ